LGERVRERGLKNTSSPQPSPPAKSAGGEGANTYIIF